MLGNVLSTQIHLILKTDTFRRLYKLQDLNVWVSPRKVYQNKDLLKEECVSPEFVSFLVFYYKFIFSNHKNIICS